MVYGTLKMCDFSHRDVEFPLPEPVAVALLVLAPTDVDVLEPVSLAVLIATSSLFVDEAPAPELLPILSTTRVTTIADELTPDPVAVRVGLIFQSAD